MADDLSALADRAFQAQQEIIVAGGAVKVAKETGMPDLDSAGLIEWEELEIIDKIGRGAFGSVFKGEYFGTTVAIKQIKKEEENREDLQIYVVREMAMTKFAHPHLVQFLGVCDYGEYVYLVTEYVPGGDLRQYIKRLDEDIPWQLRIKVAGDVAKAMAFLHSKKIMHRDIKSKNLLVDPQWNVKLCDFGAGFARTFNPGNRRPYSLCGTEDWMAPELTLGMEYDEKCDVFSFGIVLFELITRRKVTTDLSRGPEDAFGLDPEKVIPLLPKGYPYAFAELAFECCEYNPDNRPSFLQCIKRLKAMLADELERVDQIRALEREVKGLPETAVAPEPDPVAQTMSVESLTLPAPKLRAPSIVKQRALASHAAIPADGAGPSADAIVSAVSGSTSTLKGVDEIFAEAAKSKEKSDGPSKSTRSGARPKGRGRNRPPSTFRRKAPNPETAATARATHNDLFYGRKRFDSSTLPKDKGDMFKLHHLRSVALDNLEDISFEKESRERFLDAMDTTFARGVSQGWLLLRYASNTVLQLQATGIELSDLVEELQQREVQYALVRVPVEEGKTKKTRDIFIQWLGPRVGAVQKGKKKSHCGEVKTLLQPFHAELTAVSTERFTLDAVIEKSGPLSGSHVID